MTLPIETVRLEALKGLAAERFGRVTADEERVLRQSASTEDIDPPNSKDRRPVSADFLRWLATDKDAAGYIDPLGLRTFNAAITSNLNLDFCRIPFPLRFENCDLVSELSLRMAEIPALVLSNCLLASGIAADGLRVRGAILLRELNSINHPLRFTGAQIGENFECSGSLLSTAFVLSAVLPNVNQEILFSADGASVGGNLEFVDGFHCTGQINLAGAKIGGSLNLSKAVLDFTGTALNAQGADIRSTVFLSERFHCAGQMDFTLARIGGDLVCSGATLTSLGNTLVADRANIAGTVFLPDGFTCLGTVRFGGAQVGGDLDCGGATFLGLEVALVASGARIAGGFYLRARAFRAADGSTRIGKFSSVGRIELIYARVGGDLDCTDATFDNEDVALNAERAHIAGSVFLRGSFASQGKLHLSGAVIGGSLDCFNATLTATGNAMNAEDATITVNLVCALMRSAGTIRLLGAQIDGPFDCTRATFNALGDAINAEDARITGNLILTETRSAGTIRLVGTQVQGNVDCTGAALGAKGVAFVADRASVTGSIFLIKQFKSQGEIRLVGARIGGDLNCSSAALSPRASALLADGARISGNVYLVENFSSPGTIRLVDAQIDGNLNCGSAKLTAVQNALSADRAKIGQNVYLNQGFSSSTAVRFNGARIGGDLDCSGASLGGLECVGAQANGDLIWRGIQRPGYAIVNLSNSTFARLLDDTASWPTEGHLILDGLVYQDLVLSEPGSSQNMESYRIRWLKRQPGTEIVKPQPWLQFAKILEAKGNREGAKRVVYEMRRQQVLAANPLWRIATLIFDLLEEQPFYILVPMALLWLFGFVVFWRAHRMNAMCPKDKDAYDQLTRSGRLPGQYARFAPAVYALENVLPVVKLGQDEAWEPNPQAMPKSWLRDRPGFAWTRWLPAFNYPWLATFRWTLIILGWVLAGVLAAAISERFKG